MVYGPIILIAAYMYEEAHHSSAHECV